MVFKNLPFDLSSLMLKNDRVLINVLTLLVKHLGIDLLLKHVDLNIVLPSHVLLLLYDSFLSHLSNNTRSFRFLRS